MKDLPIIENKNESQSYTLLNPLEERLFHLVLVTLNSPAGWPGWLIGAVGLAQIALVGALWWLLIGAKEAFFAGMALTAFILSDALILSSLPRRRLSFGPVGPQLFTLQLPRLLVGALGILPAIWLGPVAVLIGITLINALASLALVRGALVEPSQVRLSHLTLAGHSLPHDTPPIRLLHISDLHIERIGRREEQLLQMAQDSAPDLILLSGDYLNLSCVDDIVAHSEVRRVLKALSSCVAEDRIYAVLGSPPVDRNSAPLFDGLPIRLLRNEAVTVDLGHNRRLGLLGLDCSHDAEHDAKQLAETAAKAPAGLFRVLLYHSPELMPLAPSYDIDLYLCGHTHGGQVRLPFYGAVITSSRLGKRYEMGHYQLENTHLYINRGIGLEGLGAPRVRFLCPPEIALFSLNGLSKEK